jgi:hypothetical protein
LSTNTQKKPKYRMLLFYFWKCDCDSNSGGFLDRNRCLQSAIRHIRKFNCGLEISMFCVRRRIEHKDIVEVVKKGWAHV